MAEVYEPARLHASVPSTPTSLLSAKGQGAQFYATLMSDIHHRRLKKGQCPPPFDAAGLVCGSRYQGRNTPLKGKGNAPPDNRVDAWASSKSLVPGRSFVSVNDLLSHPDPADGPTEAPPVQLGPGGHGAPSSPGAFRACMKVHDRSFRCSLQGAVLDVLQEDPKPRKMMAKGEFAPTVSTSRVFCTGYAEAEDAPAPAASTIKWEAQVAQAHVMQELEMSQRPQTAPSHASEARKFYHADFTGHQDVMRYRHSGGICPDEYKFSEVRQSAPALEVKRPVSAKEAFFDVRASYSYNRVRGLTSTVPY